MKKLLLLCFVFITTLCYGEISIQRVGAPKSKLVLGKKYAKNEIIAQFGKPYDYRKDWDGECYNAYVQVFEYDGTHLELIGDVLNSFGTSDFQVDITISNIGVIRVGMDMTFLLKLLPKQGIVQKYEDSISIFPYITTPKGGGYTDESLVVRFDKHHKIVNLRWFSPV